MTLKHHNRCDKFLIVIVTKTILQIARVADHFIELFTTQLFHKNDKKSQFIIKKCNDSHDIQTYLLDTLLLFDSFFYLHSWLHILRVIHKTLSAAFELY